MKKNVLLCKTCFLLKRDVHVNAQFHCIALYCIVLYCIVFYCIVLYCIDSILKRTSVATSFGELSFDDEGIRRTVHDLQLLNLVLNDRGRKQWRVIGSLRNDTVRFSTIVWPGNTVSGPTAKGQRTLRVVTVIVEPFVIEQPAVSGRCLTTVPCLRVPSKKKEVLDDIFKNFDSGNGNDTGL